MQRELGSVLLGVKVGSAGLVSAAWAGATAPRVAIEVAATARAAANRVRVEIMRVEFLVVKGGGPSGDVPTSTLGVDGGGPDGLR